MKLLVKKKANPAFKRPQALPLPPQFPVRLAELKNYAAAPAVVIVAPAFDPGPEVKSL